MKESLFEAFEDLDKLDDIEMLNVPIDDFEKIKSFKDGDQFTIDFEKIVDPQAENEDELKTSYLGKIILKCPVCHSLVYKALADIIADTETECVNVGEECPICHGLDGFKVIGEVKEFEDDDLDEFKVADAMKTDFERDGDIEVEDEEKEVVEVKTELDEAVSGKSLFDKIMEVAKTMKLDEDVEEDKERPYDKLMDHVDNIFHKEEAEKVDSEEEADEEVYDKNTTFGKLISHVDDIPGLEESVSERDDIDAEADDKKERARKRFLMARDAADADKDYRLHRAHMKTPDQLKESDEPAAEAIRKAQEWVDYDIKRYKGKISDKTRELVKRAGFQILEKDGKYIVASNDKALTEGRQSKNKLTTAKKDEKRKRRDKRFYKTLDDLYSAVQDSLHSDLRKANLEIDMMYDAYNDDALWAFFDKGTNVEKILKPTLDRFGLKSKQKPFRGKIEFRVLMPTDIDKYNADMRAKDIQESVKRSLKRRRMIEGFNKVNIETDDYKMDMIADENGKITVTTEPFKKNIEKVNEVEGTQVSEPSINDEVIKPVSDEVAAQIEAQSDEDYEDIDFNEIDEEKFDTLGESYLKRNYGNVKSFKTIDGSIKGNTLTLEGLITFKSGKQAKTQFIFESASVSHDGKVKFTGSNKNFARGKKSFTLTGNVKNKKLISESLRYNHVGKDAKTGKTKRLYGKVSV